MFVNENMVSFKFEHKDLQRLSTDFSYHVKNDIGKKCIYLSKVVLQGLNVWPDNRNFWRTTFFWVTIINLSFMEMGNIAYQIGNFTDIVQMASSSTSVFTTLETMLKLCTLFYYKGKINHVLVVIWKFYWPSSLVMHNKKRFDSIRRKSHFVIGMSCTFLSVAFISSNHFMAFPLVEGIRMLPCASIFPFDFTKSPTYEILYVWQWFLNLIVITTLSSFDSLFMALVMNCVFQFIILQDLFENIGTIRGKEQWKLLQCRQERSNPANTDYNEMRVVVILIRHHILLMDVCRELQNIFSHMIALQFLSNTLANCVSSVALTADPSLLPHMSSYVLAHIVQLFYYCAVGTDLSWESKDLTTSVFHSNWHLSNDINIKKSMTNIIQRSTKEMLITGSGFVTLNLQGFLKSLQLSFSVYTLLSSFV